jgi:hypothetical protein
VVSRTPPVFVDVACGTTRRFDEATGRPAPEAWNVCAND